MQFSTPWDVRVRAGAPSDLTYTCFHQTSSGCRLPVSAAIWHGLYKLDVWRPVGRTILACKTVWMAEEFPYSVSCPIGNATGARRSHAGMALQVPCHPGSLRQEGVELPRSATTRMCAPVVPSPVAPVHFEIVSKSCYRRSLRSPAGLRRRGQSRPATEASGDMPQSCGEV